VISIRDLRKSDRSGCGSPHEVKLRTPLLRTGFRIWSEYATFRLLTRPVYIATDKKAPLLTCGLRTRAGFRIWSEYATFRLLTRPVYIATDKKAPLLRAGFCIRNECARIRKVLNALTSCGLLHWDSHLPNNAITRSHEFSPIVFGGFGT
jgi:hypothetical protein